LSTGADEPARVGFVVSRRVGNAVVRNRVRRRLREQTRHRLDALPPGTLLLIRALPEAAGATSVDLAAALDRALRPRGADSSRRGGAVDDGRGPR
jgi:ribonuclease P protein component